MAVTPCYLACLWCMDSDVLVTDDWLDQYETNDELLLAQRVLNTPIRQEVMRERCRMNIAHASI